MSSEYFDLQSVFDVRLKTISFQGNQSDTSAKCCSLAMCIHKEAVIAGILQYNNMVPSDTSYGLVIGIIRIDNYQGGDRAIYE